MNILVYPHELAMGGSQLNAIEAAAAVRDRGHEVTITAPTGELVTVIEELGLPFVPTPVKSYYPSARTAGHLMDLTRRLHVDVIHAYEWRPSIEAAFGTHLRNGTPVVMTVLSMEVMTSLPRHIPLFVGTRQLADSAVRRANAMVMEPPIDVRKNAVRDVAKARRRWGFTEDELVISVVCRLALEHEKLEGVLQAVAVADDLAERLPVRMLIVGDGEGRADVEKAAQVVNRRLGREVIIVTGTLSDPRDAYEAADVVFGMGSSALKGLAFSKPLVVQGKRGFWKLFDPQTSSLFLYQGWFGDGGGGAAELKAILEPLLHDAAKRLELGQLGRHLAEERYNLDRAAERLIDVYADTIANPAPLASWLPSLGSSVVEEAKFRLVMGMASARRAFSRALP